MRKKKMSKDAVSKGIYANTVNINSRQDARDLALAFKLFQKKGISIRSGSDLIRACVDFSAQYAEALGFQRPEHRMAKEVLNDILQSNMFTDLMQKEIAIEAMSNERHDMMQSRQIVSSMNTGFMDEEMMRESIKQVEREVIESKKINPLAGIKPGQVKDDAQQADITNPVDDTLDSFEDNTSDVDSMRDTFAKLNATESEREK